MAFLHFLRPRARRLPLVLALVACLGSLALPATADPSDRLDKIERRRAKLQRGIENATDQAGNLRSTISKLDDEAEDIQAVVSSLESEVDALNARIITKQAALTQAQQRYNQLTERLLAIQSDLVERTDQFTNRAVEIYKAGPGAYVEGILSSDSFSDLTDRYQYYESALDADAELLEEIESLRAEVDENRVLVEEEKERIAKAKLQLERDRDVFAQKRTERQNALDEQRAIIVSKETLLKGQLARKSKLEALDRELQEDSERIRDLLASDSSGPTGTTGPVGGGQLAWPASGPITSGYGYRTHPIFGDGRMHTGIDIGAGYGSPVWAADGGVVVFAGTMSGYGNAIVVDHGGGLATTYNHLSAFQVSSGTNVSRGAQIGNVGCTGYCTGPHLHFEVRINGNPVDPMPYLQ